MAHNEFETPSIDWESQWQRHGRWIRTVLLARLPNRDCVEDVFQEMAIAIARNPDSWPEPTRIEPWLYRVAIHQVMAFRRKHFRRAHVKFERGDEGGFEFVDQNAIDPGEWVIANESTNQLESALDQLGPRDREILLLKHSQDWTYQQIASHIGVSIDKIIYRIKRARERLALMMSDFCNERTEQ